MRETVTPDQPSVRASTQSEMFIRSLSLLRNESGIESIVCQSVERESIFGIPVTVTLNYRHQPSKAIIKKDELIQILRAMSDHDGYDEDMFIAFMNGTQYANIDNTPENRLIIGENYQWLKKNIRKPMPFFPRR